MTALISIPYRKFTLLCANILIFSERNSHLRVFSKQFTIFYIYRLLISGANVLRFSD